MGQPMKYISGHNLNPPQPVEQRFWDKVDKSGGPDACWPWGGSRGARGYGQFALTHEKMVSTHRYAYQIAVGDIPAELWVLHRCDNPPCCNPAHLFLGTPTDNVHDMMRKGRDRQPLGSQHGCAKLTEDDVWLMRLMRQGGIPLHMIAAHFWISQGAASAIVRGKKWRHVPMP